MSRPDRRYQGGPEHALDTVRACIAVCQLQISRRAQYEDGPRVLPPGTIDVFGAIKDIVVALTELEWRFAQVRNGEWVDVYQVKHENAVLWVKIKVEMSPHSKQYTVVVSFHEWDFSRPI